MDNNQLIDKIQSEILGIPQYGFEDEKWLDFAKKYCYREGVIDGDSYSSKVNTLLSHATISHAIGEKRKQLDELRAKEYVK